jgi:hypothetical protein
MNTKLFKRIMEIQEKEGLSDRSFADKLGLSNGHWSGMKTGRLVMGRKTVIAIKKHYPDLAQDAKDYWLDLIADHPQ